MDAIKSGVTAPEIQSPLNQIPAELRALPQWVCWHYETRNDKQTKPPIQPKSNGKLLHARSNGPSTWSDFYTAVAAEVGRQEWTPRDQVFLS